MRSDCDLVIWIKTREAAASGLIFFRSANDVILAGETIEPSFFHSVQIMQSSEVLPVTDRPPHPQQVALAISRAPLQATASRGRDAQNRRPYMLLLTASMHTARAMPSAMPCAHSLWTYARIKAQAVPLATGASEVSVLHLIRVELFEWVSPGEGNEDDPDLQVAVASANSSKQSWSSLHTQSLISCAVPI